jgi:VWFA-related protein
MRKSVGAWITMLAVAGTGLALSLGAAPQSGSAQPGNAQSGNTNPGSGQSGVIRRDVDLVSIYFTVRNSKKQLESRLAKDAFRVYEDGREQPIEFFSRNSDVPLDLGVLLDTDTSMARILGLEAEASSLFLSRVVRKNDLGFVVSYDAHVTTVQVPTADVSLLVDQVQTIRRFGRADQIGGSPRGPYPGGGTMGMPNTDYREAHLYDAVRISVHRYLASEIGRKAVVIVALSDDSKSESALEDAIDALQKSDVIAYVLQIYDGPHDSCDVRHIFHAEHLKKLAEETGGRVIQVRGMDKMQAAFDEISEELHNQYSLGYRPQNTNWDGKYRKIQIAAKDGGYKVFARRGYYANAPASR